MGDVDLPRFDIPELSPKPMTFEEYCRWTSRYVDELLASGKYADVRDRFCCLPVDVRFRLTDVDPADGTVRDVPFSRDLA